LTLNFAKTGSDAITIYWRIEQWFPDLSPEIKAKLKKFHEELIRVNKTSNLISIKTLPMADAIHFADAINATRLIEKDLKSEEIYDLGAGNGFPGLIMALLMPKVKIHLVEVDGKKAEFLKQMIGILELKNVDVLIRAIETLPADSIRCAASRGLAPISKSLLMTRKAFTVGGVYYHLKGEEWATEIAGIPTQLCSFWQPGLLGEYKLPVGEVKFAVVKTEKIQA
jgi:16S rRNA (guanine527-N7)-methyltransferase